VTVLWPLRWFEPLTALQATCFAARRDQSTEWAHPLGSEIFVARVPEDLPD
jgi:hypothetical protein